MVAAPAPFAESHFECAARGARERLFLHLGVVELPLGKVLYEPGAFLRHVLQVGEPTSRPADLAD